MDVELVELPLEIIEIFDLDQAIACLFGRVLIYKATGESSHLITVESLDLFKLTRGYAIATVFAELYDG